MPSSKLWAGALSLVLVHAETGCPQSALNAARLLECLGDMEEIDADTRNLCERASIRLSEAREVQNAGPASDLRTSERLGATAQPSFYQKKTNRTNHRAADGC